MWLEKIFKSFESFWIFCRNLRHGSQKSIYVSRVKIAEETVFLFFFSEFFRILSENFFGLLAEKRQEFVKTTFYVSRGTVCGLKFFSKVLNGFGFSAQTFGMVLKNLSTCPELKLRKKQFFYFSFQNFFGFWAKTFSDFWPKNVKNSSKLPFTCPEEQFVAWIFLSFESFPIFFRNHWHGSQNSIYESRLKIAEKNCFFFCFPPRIFFDFWAKIFQTFGQIFKKFWKPPSACPEEQFVAWIFFKKFWIVLDFLQKPLAWFSNVYLRVQSKNCGRNSFLNFLFRIFFGFWAKIFSDFRRKIFKICQNHLLRVQRNNLWLEIFFKSFESFWIFCRNLWLGSQISIYMSRVKIAEEKVFLFFFSELFRILRENFFRHSAKKLQKILKTTFYVSRGTICGLKFFSKFLNRFGFSAETFGMVLKFLSTCQE